MDLLTSGERSGDLLKSRVTDVDDLLETLGRIVRGGSVVDPALVQELVAARRVEDPLDVLSPREREVLTLMAEGRSNAGIARQLLGDGRHGREARAQHPRKAPPAREHRRPPQSPRRAHIPRDPLTSCSTAAADSSDFGTKPAAGVSAIRSPKSASARVEIKITVPSKPDCSQTTREVESALRSERDVDERHVGSEGINPPQGFRGRRCDTHHLQALALEQRRRRVQERRAVVDDQTAKHQPSVAAVCNYRIAATRNTRLRLAVGQKHCWP